MKSLMLLATLALTSTMAQAHVSCEMSVNGQTKYSVPGYKGTPNIPWSSIPYRCNGVEGSERTIVATIEMGGEILAQARGRDEVGFTFLKQGYKGSSTDNIVCECTID